MTAMAMPAARPWLLISTEAGTDMFGAPVPAGTAVARQMWNGVTPWSPPPGIRLEPDDGRPIWQPRPPPPPPSGTLATHEWLARLPRETLVAICQAALGDARLLCALLLLLGRGTLDLGDPDGALRDFLALAAEGTGQAPHGLTEAATQAMFAP